MKTLFQSFYTKYERHIALGVFILGFVWDFFTLNRIDQLLDNLVLTAYLVIAGFCIVFYQAYKSGRVKRPFLVQFARFSPLVVQFAFGGLFSGYLIFYSRSATFLSSWPFLIMIFAMFLGNEFLRRRYYKLIFQLGIYFLSLFSYFIFLVPVLIGKIGTKIFILSGILALLVIMVFIIIILHFGKNVLVKRKFGIIMTILLIYFGFNFAYFKNWIPPVPLSLKEMGLYHYVDRNIDGSYVFGQQDQTWLDYIPFRLDRFKITSGNKAYLFTSIFAPTRLNTNIIHKWFYYDVSLNDWREVATINYEIQGGRDKGYRGFSVKTVFKGIWRVDVLTIDNRLIGSKKFIVD